jgi:hypothetical protein
MAVALLAVGGPACGAAEPTRVEGGRVIVDLDEFSLRPQDIVVRAGPVEFRGRNVGAILHSPAIRRKGRPVAATGVVRPGGVKTARVVLRRGEYRLFCGQANHEALGMYGRLRVR